MKAHLLTDIHNEHRTAPYRVADINFDVLVLAGDIDSGLDGITWAAGESQRLGVPVIYVAGNHEYYGTELLSHEMAMRELAASVGVHYLNNDAVVINGVRFMGTTLWTDYQLTGDDPFFVHYQIKRAMSDHRLIRYGDRLFSTEQAFELHQQSISWLEKSLQSNTSYQANVVVSHHGPSELCVHPAWKKHIVTNAYCSNLEHLVEQSNCWFYGHTHAALDTKVGKARLVSNPAGYPDQETGFEPKLVIDILRGECE
ncbi:metallophosphoesterase [Alcanivorax sp. 97CO-5]|uniref:metallophosphoesterase n=1 Tax=unclassified Alcanivorax TaxID=2638842 RepID=UPI0003E8027C|nr:MULTISPECIES: metallophosphoesterase [unclassified Alcanivorax]EUC69837.1 metallophosphoesterase [Alcanivorax sp. 97CO-5]PKG01681.1 hypothetical protein Y019_07960 [Alcanivorax sp. 97CO-6]